jgi:pyruvate dehydrogenase E2 component (dihydrolipoamide acetyltransferase)
MATFIEMPKLSDTMDAGVLVAWKKKEGDAIQPGDVIAEVESDKATMELEAYDPGVLRKLLAKVGEPVPVGEPIAIVADSADEDIAPLLERARKGKSEKVEGKREEAAAPPKGEASQHHAPAPGSKPAPPAPVAPAPPAPAPDAGGGGRVLVSPLAARLAQEWGIDLTQIQGSGPDGRIVKRDVEQAKAQGAAPRAPIHMVPSAPVGQLGHPEQEYEDIVNSPVRKIIAQRLTESKTQTPHYYVTVEIDMNQAVEMRRRLNALDGVKISLNDFVIKAAALAIEKHPLVNASYRGGHVRVYHRIDIGNAVAMDDGLVTPVIRNANKKGLRAIARESRELAERARAKKLKPEDYTGGTFTISNLGMMGVKHFTAVINPPEAAILAIGAVRETPVIDNGKLAGGRRMDVTLSSDHRVLDGAQSARFLQDFKYYLENPITFAL